MRVLLVSQEFPPETHWGGIATYLSILAPALAQAGAEVHVLSVVPGQSRSTTTFAPGVTVHRAPLVRPRGIGRLTGLPETWGRLSLAWNVWREARRLDLRPDVIEGTAWNAEALGLARARLAPVVVRIFSSANEILPLIGPLNRDRRWAIALETELIRRATLITGTKGQLGKAIPRLGLERDRVRQISCPVALAADAGDSPDRPTICFVGRFESRKGPDTLVRAMTKVTATVPDALLVLNGHDTSDSTRDSFALHLRELVTEANLDSSVVVNERWGDHAGVLREMADSTVCVMPSRWESFGYVAAEAAALGRPVVASDIPALAEVVADGASGLLVPPEDVDAWADAIVELLTDPERARDMGRHGRQLMTTGCAPAVIAEQTLEAYSAAIARYRAA